MRSAVVDQALDLGPAQRRIVRGDERIEPRAGVGLRRDQLAAAGTDVDSLVVVFVLGLIHYQIFDLTCPLDFTSTSTIARS